MNSPRAGTFFINYRIDDSKDFARRLERALETVFGPKVAFRDESDINLTSDWDASLKRALEQAELLLAVIGPDWVSSFVKKAEKQETQAITDWVRKEIEFALDEGIDVIPILLPNTQLCSPKDAPEGFPESLHPMLTRQGFTLHKGSEEEDVQEIIQSLKVLLNPKAADIQAYKALPPLAALALPEEYIRRLRAKNKMGKPKIKSPYLGPIYYGEDHAAIFYGREWEIRKLFHLVRRHSLALLRGYSGTGKSSLLHAGLLPRLRGLEHWQVWDPIRRDKQAGGLHKQLEAFLENFQPVQGKKGLLILDQVEEMYTDPLKDGQEEIPYFGEVLNDLLDSNPELHVLLVFRSEFMDKINLELLDDYLPTHMPGEMYLGPISYEGVQQAILGPTQWERKFRLDVKPETAELIAKDFVGDDFSPYGILLQIQLLHLWELAEAEAVKTGSASPRIISSQLYQAHRQGDLDAFIDKQLAYIQAQYDWGERIKEGLGLDVLYQFSTEEGTATSMKDSEFQALYQELEGIEALELLNAFKRVYLISEAGLQEGSSRLSHDSIARFVRRKYLNSDACAQRAWRIVETKQREIGQGFEGVSLSESDIASLEEGKPHMRAIPQQVAEIWSRDAQLYQERRQKRFDFAYKGAQNSIENLAYKKALEQLRIALHEGIHLEMLRALAWELPYVFIELEEEGLLRESLAFLGEAGERKEWMESLTKDKSGGLEEIREVLSREEPEWYATMKAQYYPEMIQISGGSFEMGSDDGIFNDEDPVHPVAISEFYLGATSVTFFQYGLYCLLTDKRLPLDSGFGRGKRPVINVSWSEALHYCNWLSQRLEMQAIYSNISETDAQVDWETQGFRLPTEAEWEYAAREGGKVIRFGNGKDHANLGEINFDGETSYNDGFESFTLKGESLLSTSLVKSYSPNALGLYDLSGNVYDWCWDWYDADTYYKGNSEIINDPRGPSQSPENNKSIRGGSWYNPAYQCRCASRVNVHPRDSNGNVGFRVAGYLTL